jgi:hypothetical protein
MDATLHTGIWHKIQEQFGGGTGNTIDLMSVDSNTMKDYNGKILKHFTPYPTPLSAGVNLFSQTVLHPLMLSRIEFKTFNKAFASNTIMGRKVISLGHESPNFCSFPSIVK